MRDLRLKLKLIVALVPAYLTTIPSRYITLGSWKSTSDEEEQKNSHIYIPGLCMGLDSAWDWSPGTLFPGYRIGHVAELMIATSGKNDADDFHDECYIAPPSAGNLPATTTILRRSRAEMAIGKQLGSRIQGHRYGIGGVLHISLSLHQQQLPSHQNAILLQTSQLASAQTRGEKERKISFARFQLSRHTTHDTQKNKEKKK